MKWIHLFSQRQPANLFEKRTFNWSSFGDFSWQIALIINNLRIACIARNDLHMEQFVQHKTVEIVSSFEDNGIFVLVVAAMHIA